MIINRLGKAALLAAAFVQLVTVQTHVAVAQSVLKDIIKEQSRILTEQTQSLKGVVGQYDNALKNAQIARGFPGEDLKWPSNWIDVCWEDASSENEKERAWVRDAVEKSWEAHSRLRFLGWRQCIADSGGIRIAAQDSDEFTSSPHTRRLGRELDGLPNGIVLNFTFSHWGTSCAESETQRESCIRAIAVHEFGHAIGFGNTQDRSDTPADCAAHLPSHGPPGISQLTPWDPRSVMNFCNPTLYATNGALSEYDVIALQLVYGSPLDLSKFSVEYFRKDLDGNKVLDVLAGLGIKPDLKKPIRSDVPTDAVIFSRDVPPEIVKSVALALVKGGVAMKALIYYGDNPDRPLPARVRLLQLGTAGVDGLRALSEHEIATGVLPLARN